MMPPQAAPPQSQSVEFRTVPGQRAQFKSFMQGMRAKPAMNPPISSPQIPVNVSPIDMIDIFDQPVQFMQRGGITNRPVAEMDYKPEVEKSRIQKALERREKARQMDDSNERRNFPKLTPTPTKTRDRGGILNVDTRTADEIAAANAVARALQGSRPSDEGTGAVINQTLAELAGASSTDQLPVKRTASYDPDYITPLESVALNQGDSLDMLNFIGGKLSDSAPFLPMPSSLDPVDRRRMDPDLTRAGIAATFLDPRQSGLGTSLSEQISRLQGVDANIDDTNQNRSFPTETRTEIQQLDDEDKDATTVLKAIEPNFLSRLPGKVGDFFYKGQIDNFKKLASLPNFSYDNETGVGTVPVGSRGGELVLSPSGVITYRGQKDPNYSVDDPFANLIRPFDRKSKDVFQAPKAVTDPCPDGFQLVNGVCQPIASQSTATQTPMITAAPTATTPTTQVIVPSSRQSAPIEQVAPVAFPVDMISNLTKPFGMQEGGAVSDTLTAATDRFLESMRAAS